VENTGSQAEQSERIALKHAAQTDLVKL